MSFNKLVATVCDTDAFTEAMELGLSIKLVPSDSKNVFRFLVNHHSEYGKSPSLERLREHFPDKVFVTSSDSIPELLDDVRQGAFNTRMETLLREESKRFLEQRNSGVSVRGSEAFKRMRAALLDFEEELSPSTDLQLNSDVFQEEMLEDYETRKNSGGITGIPYPWPTANLATGGVHGGELVSILARPGTGKTWWLVAWAAAVWQANHTVLFSSNEMGSRTIAGRLMANTAKLPYREYKNAELDSMSYARFTSALTEATSRPNDFVVTGVDDDMSMGGIISLESKIKRYNPDIVFIDGAYLLDDDMGGKNKYERAGNIARGLKILAKRRDMPVVITWQFNRNASSESGMEKHAALTDSLSTDCDAMFGLFQTDTQRAMNEMMVQSIKIRESEPLFIPCNFDLQTMDLSEQTVRIPDESYEDPSDVEDDVPEY